MNEVNELSEMNNDNSRIFDEPESNIKEKIVMFEYKNYLSSEQMNKKTNFSSFPLVALFEQYQISMKLDNSPNSNIYKRSFPSNQELILQINQGMTGAIFWEFKHRFGWPFFSILIPLSVVVCIINFFGELACG